MVLRTRVRGGSTVEDADGRDAEEADVEEENDSLDGFLELAQTKMDDMETGRVVEVLPVDALVVLGGELALHPLQSARRYSLRHPGG